MHPLDFVSKKEYARYAEIGWLAENADKNFINAEDGSQKRFDTIFKKHYGWWLVHNLIAHVWIGIMPTKRAFNFHDYTSRKMRQ